MRQYRITTDNISQSNEDDAYLAPDDPIHELIANHYMGGLGSEAKLSEYRAAQSKHNLEINKENTVSGLTGTEKRQLERDHHIRPGIGQGSSGPLRPHAHHQPCHAYRYHSGQ